jgi:hypothetical protein
VPGSDRHLAVGDLPVTSADPRLTEFAGSFDAPAAFGDDLGQIHERMRTNVAENLGLPRDIGMLRGALWRECRSADPDRAFIDSLLKTMTWLV